MADVFRQPLAEALGGQFTSRQLSSLAGLGHATLGDLLLHLPLRHEDRRRFDSFPNQPMDRPVCLHGRITDVKLRGLPGRKFVEVTLENQHLGPFDSPIICRWFQMSWLSRSFAVDQEMVIHGKPKWSGKRLAVDHPDFELIEPGEESGSLHLGRVTPIYPLTGGLNQRLARQALHAAVHIAKANNVADLLPPKLVPPDLPSKRVEALAQAHFPEELNEAAAGKRYLALEELTLLLLFVLRRRASRATRHSARRQREVKGTIWSKLRDSLPFTLTDSQELAIREIQGDLTRAEPMNRLLQGDVGAGKTIVAVAAMLLAVESGCQAAFMAPTQILAEQQYDLVRRWLEPLGIRVGLRTADRVEDGFLPLFAGGEEPEVLIGTHALLGTRFSRLGLVVIDEQHKFGVAQRASLANQGETPDILVMTATPIPRTLALSIHGDLDVSLLRESPKGRGAIVTAIRPITKTQEAAEFLRQQVAAGRQAYIVYPLLEDSEKLALASATTAFAEWRERLPDLRIGLLHGRMTAEEKQDGMAKFRDGRMDVLVATTVVEVGLDVPNANLMLIYHAERFGLAQLHQLRGRIGRGPHKSYCVLMCDGDEAEAQAKLGILAETRDGFRIAEADLLRRGPGDLLGTEQSGLPKLRSPDSLADLELVSTARSIAEKILAEDPELKEARHDQLAQALAKLAQTASGSGG